MNLLKLGLALAVAAVASGAAQAAFTVGNIGTQNDNFIIGQGFSPSVEPAPNPGLSAGDTVYLTSFRFNKSLFASGGVLNEVNTRLVIFNQVYPDFNGADDATPITLASGAVVGISTNTIDTTPLGDGDAINFVFNNLALTYGANYSAYLVTVGGANELTPARVSLKSATYAETPPGSGTWLPNPNYGPTGSFNYVALTPIGASGFAGAFGGEGDANFQARFEIPEPAAASLLVWGVAILAWRRRTATA
ncbi:MAG TPA: hypothetical protein PJ982_02765 [Lacipirellulaceae bacterium]|nr:hypothetical protein [Lacipirellulaceae bacterium]